MGFGFVIAIWWFIGLFLSILFGLSVAFLVFPALYAIRRTPKSRRLRWYTRLLVSAGFAGVAGIVVTALVALSVLYVISYGTNYWKFPGVADGWRTPLEYPYEVSCIDHTNYGTIEKSYCIDSAYERPGQPWPEVEPPLHFVVSYYKEGPMVVGSIGNFNSRFGFRPGPPYPVEPDTVVFFTLDCTTGRSHVIQRREDFRTELESLGLPSDPHLKSVDEHHRDYWREHDWL